MGVDSDPHNIFFSLPKHGGDEDNGPAKEQSAPDPSLDRTLLVNQAVTAPSFDGGLIVAPETPEVAFRSGRARGPFFNRRPENREVQQTPRPGEE
jgi:hypothetical protein